MRRDTLLVKPPHHTAQAGQRTADYKDPDEQPFDAVTERLHHLPVLHASANQQANLGAAQRPGQQTKHRQPDPHRQHTVFFDGCIAQQQGATQALRQRQGNLRRAPDHLDEFFTNDHAAHGDQDLLQVLAVHRAHNKALERQPDRTRHQHGHQHGREDGHQVAPQVGRAGPVTHQAQHRGRHKSTQRDEHAVAKIQHVHQAEHQRQPGGNDENDHPHREARHRERQPGRR